MISKSIKDVIVIGAGPIGLAMGIRLVHHNYSFTILEKGNSVGNNMLQWGGVHLFSNWENSIDPLSLEAIQNRGITFPNSKQCPSGKDFVGQYLEKLTNVPSIQENLKLQTEVTKVRYDKTTQLFDVHIQDGNQCGMLQSKTVIDASGTWGSFNPIIENQSEFKNYIYKGIVDQNTIIDKDASIAVIGNGHSAMNSIIALSTIESRKIYWLIRSKEPKFGKSKVEGKSDHLEIAVSNLIDKNKVQLITEFSIVKIEEVKDTLLLTSSNNQIISGLTMLVLNTGFCPDFKFLENISLALDQRYEVAAELSDKINPNLHSCNTVSYQFSDTIISDVPYYVVGMKSFGKASNFLLTSGYKILDELILHLRSTLNKEQMIS